MDPVAPKIPQSGFLSPAALGLAAVLIAYGAILYVLGGAVAGGSDNSGYFNEARLFSQHTVHAQSRALAGFPASEAPPYLYVPLGFKPVADGSAQLVPTYPPGLSLMLVPVARMAGWRHSGDILLIVHSLAGIALIYALALMCGLPPPWALFGSALLAASPLYLYTSLQALSDVPATVWALAAVLAAWRSRERTGWALAAGLSIAVAFLVRPSNFLIVLPVAIAIGASPRRLMLAALGTAPGIAAWMAINHAAYGGYLQSGYGAIWNEFHPGLIPGTLWYCVKWLPILFSPIVIASPAIVAAVRSRPRVATVLASWAVAFIGFYSAYRWTHESWWFLRFLLPAAPAFIVAGLVMTRMCFDGLRSGFRASWLRALAALLVFASIGAELTQVLSLDAWSIGRGERKYGRVASWLVHNLPPNSVIVVNQFSGSMFYFTDFTFLRGDQLDAKTAESIRKAVKAEKRPLFSVLFQFENDLASKIPGRWNIISMDDGVLVQSCDLSDRK
jgi:opacity protein-like surface antigen